MLAPQAPSFSLLGDNKHVAAEIATPNGTGAYGGGTYEAFHSDTLLARPATNFQGIDSVVEAHEPRVPEVAIRRPLYELELGDQGRLQPPADLYLLGGQPLAPPPAFGFGEVRKRRSGPLGEASAAVNLPGRANRGAGERACSPASAAVNQKRIAQQRF